MGRRTIGLVVSVVMVGLVLAVGRPGAASFWPAEVHYEVERLSHGSLTAPLEKSVGVFRGRDWAEWSDEIVAGAHEGHCRLSTSDGVFLSTPFDEGCDGRLEPLDLDAPEGPIEPGQIVPNFHIREGAYEWAVEHWEPTEELPPTTASVVAGLAEQEPELSVAAYRQRLHVTCAEYGLACPDGAADEPLVNETVSVFHEPTGLQLAYHETLDGQVVHRFSVTQLSLRDDAISLPSRP